MGIVDNNKIVATESDTCTDGTELELHMHRYSGIVHREAFGEVTTGSAEESSGYDLLTIGEDETNIIIHDQPACGCVNGKLRSGSKRMRDTSGNIGRYFEPAPRTWTLESAPQASGGNGPASDGGDVALITGMNLEVKSSCYPLNIRPRIEICDWQMYPTDPKSVAGYVEWTIFQTVAAAEREQVLIKRCHPVRPYGGGPDKNLGSYDLPAESTFEVYLDAGLHYFDTVTQSFDANLAEIKIVADVTEITSFDALTTAGC